MLCFLNHRSGQYDHIVDERDDVKFCEGFRVSLIVFDKAITPCCLRKEPSHDPTLGRQTEAMFGFGQLGDLKLDAQCGGVLCHGLASVVLIDISEGNGVARDGLNVSGKPGHGLLVADITSNVSKCPNVSIVMWVFDPRLRLLPPCYTARDPTSFCKLSYPLDDLASWSRNTVERMSRYFKD